MKGILSKNIVVPIVIFLIDYIWFYFSKGFYKDRIEKIQKEKLKVKNAGVFITYTILFAGLYYIMNINSKPKNIYQAAERGAVYGFVTYSIFNGTNMSIFNEWDEKISIVDTSWGTILNCIAGCLYFTL